MEGLVDEGSEKPQVWSHQICEALFYTDAGQPWRLNRMPYFKPIYNNSANKLLLRTSRQSTKTTFIRNKLTTRSIMQKGNMALYVAPTMDQVSTFSKQKLDSVFDYNERLEEEFKSPSLDWNVKTKMFDRTRSTIFLRSVGGHRGARSTRGITANDIYKDEYQSLPPEVLGVIDEVAATFDGKDGRKRAYYVNTGTPLGIHNPIEKEWSRSKGYEWMIQCPHCSEHDPKTGSRKGGWNEPIGISHVDKSKPYLFCQHCGKDMNKTPLGEERPPCGQWVATNPNGRFPGYRVVRLMVPWARWRTQNNDGILDRLDEYSERKFRNEVMGLPFEGGDLPITEKDIRRCAGNYDLPQTHHEEMEMARKHRSKLVFAGLDWAMSGDDNTASYTKVGIFAYVNGKLKLIHAEKFTGAILQDPDKLLDRIANLMNRYGVTLIGCDYGMGYNENQRLKRRFPDRVITLHYYGHSTGDVKTKYDPQGEKYTLPRTPSINEFIRDLKSENFHLPRWEDTRAQEHLKDWTRIVREVNDKTRTIQFASTGTDDFLHVANYANMAKRMYYGGELVEEAPAPQKDDSYHPGDDIVGV